MHRRVTQCLFTFLLLSLAWSTPLYHHDTPFVAVNDITSRVAARPARLQEARLPPPTLQNIETIKKVAQILIMLGEQVIPGVIGELPPHAGGSSTPQEIPNDPVIDE